MAETAPTLETERLVLRPLRADDLDDHAALFADPEVVRYLGSQPLVREEAWRRLSAVHGAWSLLGFGFWAIESREDKSYSGVVGFADFKREMTPGLGDGPEMGWIVAPRFHGRGMASEAVTAALAWADNALGAPEIAAIIDPENAASIRVAEKAGFRSAGPALYRGETILTFRRPASRASD